MKIEGFRFRNIGPFGAAGLSVDALTPGLNVIVEPNERGKSSLMRALQLFLLKPHRSADRDVKRLARPDGSPSGEIDFSHEGQVYRLIKTFQRGRSAQLLDRETSRVLARDGEADARMAELMGASGKATGPSGLLWVAQGLSMDPIEDDGLVASKLETEMSSLVGGERARDYLNRTESALGELVTTLGRPKAGGPLKQAEDALQAIEAELDTARQLRAETREIGKELATVRAALASLEKEDPDKRDDAAIAEARQALDLAKTARATLETAQAKARSLEVDRDEARRLLSTHMATCTRYGEAASGIEEETAKIAALEKTCLSLTERQREIDEERRVLQLNQSQLVDAQKAQANIERLEDRQRALQQVESRLDALEQTLNERARHIEARDAQPDVDRGTLDHLAQMERDRDKAERALAQVEARLVLDLLPDAQVRLNGKRVKSGTIRLDAASVLQVDGMGEIRLNAPEADSLRRAHERLSAALATRLSQIGVSDYQAAADAFRARAEITADIRLIDRDRDRIAPDGYDTLAERQRGLQQEVETLSTMIEAAPTIDADISAEQLQQDLTTLSAQRDVLQAEMVTLSGDLEAARTRLDAFERVLSELPKQAAPDQRAAVQAELSAAAATADTRLETARTDLAVLQARTPTDPALLEAQLNRLIQARENRARRRAELKDREIRLSTLRSGTLERRDPDIEVKALEDRRDRIQERVEQLRRRANALTLLRDTLIASQKQLQDAYTAPVRAELAPLLAQVIDGADLSLTDRLGAQGLSRDGRDDNLEQLSGGTREQIAILTRLAFARLLARGGQPCPVILDDALVYADDERRERMFNVLNYVASGEDAVQLIYLSCHEQASDRLGGHRLILTDWPSA